MVRDLPLTCCCLPHSFPSIPGPNNSGKTFADFWGADTPAYLATWFDQSGGGNHIINYGTFTNVVLYPYAYNKTGAGVTLILYGSTYVLAVGDNNAYGAALNFTNAVFPQSYYATLRNTNTNYGTILSSTHIAPKGATVSVGICTAPPDGLYSYASANSQLVTVNGVASSKYVPIGVWSTLVIGKSNPTGNNGGMFTNIAHDPDHVTRAFSGHLAELVLSWNNATAVTAAAYRENSLIFVKSLA